VPLTGKTLTENYPMPITPNSINIHNYTPLRPERRIALEGLLEPRKPFHTRTEISVSAGELNALKVANSAIDDTWRILNFGSGNQYKHVIASQGESYKRTQLAYSGLATMDTGFADARLHSAFTAARFQAGNCDQMADVNALLASASGINQQVSKVHANDVGHAFVVIGDPREGKRLVVSDAWPEFSRAMRLAEFSLLGGDPQIVQRYENGYRPEIREHLLHAPKANQSEVDSRFAADSPRVPVSGQPLVDAVLRSKTTYSQRHASNNLGAAYISNNPFSPGYVDQSMSEEQLLERMRKSGRGFDDMTT
jgi:hypothetical protein